MRETDRQTNPEAIFALGGGVIGLELFDAPATFKALIAKLITLAMMNRNWLCICNLENMRSKYV